jgi:FkbM family methyltransferase
MNLATVPLAPALGQHVPLRGFARLLNRSYSKLSCQPGKEVKRSTNKFGDSFELDLSSFLEWYVWVFGAFEGYIAELFDYLIRPGENCIDVGANIGIHAVRLAKLVNAKGSVVAIEADEELAGRISTNVSLNCLENVRIIQAAASERSGGSLVLHRPADLDTMKLSGSVIPHPTLTGPSVRVATVAIDDIIQAPVSLIKIDVEGYETPVIKGASRVINEHSPSIVFEYAPHLLGSASDSPFQLLREFGYCLFEVREIRNRITGRARLALRSLDELPGTFMNILAISPRRLSRVLPLTDKEIII